MQNLAQTLLDRLKSLILSVLPTSGEKTIGNVVFMHKDRKKHCSHCLSRPMAALTVQGNKMICLGANELLLGPGDCMITSVDTPHTSFLLDASADNPFLGLYFLIDKKILTDLLDQLEREGKFGAPPNTHERILHGDADFIDAFLRLARHALNPVTGRLLGPLVLRELHFLLLASPQGYILNELYAHDASDKRIIDAINWLKQHLGDSIPLEELARIANMSVSSLHRHFKSITGFSPLQYHKQLRLYEAQRLMLMENERADMAALAVGYESITQFNREYKRMFGQPPHRDICERRKRLSL